MEKVSFCQPRVVDGARRLILVVTVASTGVTRDLPGHGISDSAMVSTAAATMVLTMVIRFVR